MVNVVEDGVRGGRDTSSSVEERVGGMGRRSWTAAASRGTAVTGGTAAAGDDDQSERDREGNEKLIYVTGLI